MSNSNTLPSRKNNYCGLLKWLWIILCYKESQINPINQAQSRTNTHWQFSEISGGRRDLRQKQVLHCITSHNKHGRDSCDNLNTNNHKLSIAAQRSIQPYKAWFKFQKFDIAVVSISRANKTASHNFSECIASNCDQQKAPIIPDQTS